MEKKPKMRKMQTKVIDMSKELIKQKIEEDILAHPVQKITLPDSISFEINNQVRNIQTKQEVTQMLQPVLTGYAETAIHTEKLQIDLDLMNERLSALEIVFKNGKGDNWIFETLCNKIADEVSN